MKPRLRPNPLASASALLPGAWLLALLLLLTSLGTARAQPLKPGDVVPDWTLPRTGRPEKLQLYDFSGQIVILDFFHWWCPACRSGSAILDRFLTDHYAARGGTNRWGVPVTVLSVNRDGGRVSDAPNALRFVEALGGGLVVDDQQDAFLRQFIPASALEGGTTMHYAIINGVAGAMGRKPWELLRAETYIWEDPNLRALVDSIRPVTAILPPAITRQPDSKDVTEGDPVVMKVEATGTGPLTYQWHRNGIPLAGLTSSQLRIDACRAADSGDYSCLLRGPAAEVRSANASLSVFPNTPVTFADAQLESVVRSAISRPEGPILPVMMTAIQSLRTFNRITNLTGLQWAVRAAEIELVNSWALEFKPIAGLTNLVELELGADQDRGCLDLEMLQSLISLKSLSLRNPRAKSLDWMASLAKLQSFTIWEPYGQRSQMLPRLPSLPNLDSLDINYCSHSNSLDALDRNRLKVLVFRTVTKSEAVDWIKIAVTFTNLASLGVSCNDRSLGGPAISLPQLPNSLRYLAFSDLAVSNGDWLQSLTNLTTLRLNAPGLSLWPSIPVDANLSWLECANMPLADPELLPTWKNLRALILKGCLNNPRGLSAALDKLPRLEYLNLDDNRLSSLDGLFTPATLNRLEDLSTQGNALTNISMLRTWTNCRYLNLTENWLDFQAHAAELNEVLGPVRSQGRATRGVEPIIYIGRQSFPLQFKQMLWDQGDPVLVLSGRRGRSADIQSLSQISSWGQSMRVTFNEETISIRPPKPARGATNWFYRLVPVLTD